MMPINFNPVPVYVFRFAALPPSFNGGRRRNKAGELVSRGGLLRMHWSVRALIQDEWDLLVKEQVNNVFGGIAEPIRRCRVVWTIMNDRLLDWDNACAAFKVVGDALVHAGVIVDDNPEVIIEFRAEQEKVKKKFAGCSVAIYVLEGDE